VKGLPGLIRVNQWKLDEARRTLAGFESLAEEFRRQVRMLDVELRREAEVARSSPNSAQTYAQYLSAARARRHRLDTSLAEVTRQVAEAHGAVTSAFQELRRYELAQENRERRQADVTRRRDQIRTDEVGLNLYRRRG
jgi:hypothetical protein